MDFNDQPRKALNETLRTFICGSLRAYLGQYKSMAQNDIFIAISFYFNIVSQNI
jgi:hypothetical protein